MKYPGVWMLVAAGIGVIFGQAGVVGIELWPWSVVMSLVGLGFALRKGLGVFLCGLLLLSNTIAWRAAQQAAHVPLTTSDVPSPWLVRVHGPVDYLELTKGTSTKKARVRLELLGQRIDGRWLARSGVVRAVVTVPAALAGGDVLELMLRVRTWPSPRDARARTPHQMRTWFGLDGTASARSVGLFRHRQHGWAASIQRARLSALEATYAGLTKRTADWVAALAFGSKASMSRDYRITWGRAGLAHLLAISGLHMGVLLVGVLVGLGWVIGWVRPWVERYSVMSLVAIPALVVVWLFCVLVGAPVSALRATMVATVLVAGRLGGYSASGLNILGLCGALIALYEPRMLGQPGWLLSFSATAMLLIWLDQIQSSGPRGWVRSLWRVSWLAWLGTAAWCLLFFGQISWVGPWLNMLVVPWISWSILPGALVLGALCMWGVPIPDWVAQAIDTQLALIEALVELCLQIPGSDMLLSVPTVSEAGALAIFLVLLGVSVLARRLGLALMVVLLIALVFVGLGARWDFIEHGVWVIEQPYVGHGDGAIMRLPSGQVVVVDAPGPSRPGGWDPGRDVLGRLLEERGVQRIDVAVMTHPHWDHVGGFDYLSKRFEIGEVWLGGDYPRESSRLAGVLKRIERDGGKIALAHQLAREFDLGGVGIEILHPRSSTPLGRDPNDHSLVMRLSYGERSVLWTGDMSARVERLLADSWRPTELVKVPHHGSDTSSTQAFIRSIEPIFAWVSCAEGAKPGVPDARVIDRYVQAGAPVMRSDRDGMISMRTDGGQWQLITPWTDKPRSLFSPR